MHSHRTSQAMSEEQFSALLTKLKEDAGLQEKLRGAGDLDAAVALAKEAGFDVTNADWLKHQAKQTLALSDEELEAMTGGILTLSACLTVTDLLTPPTYSLLRRIGGSC